MNDVFSLSKQKLKRGLPLLGALAFVGVALFSPTTADAQQAFTDLSPNDGITLTNDSILIRWNTVTNANDYKITVECTGCDGGSSFNTEKSVSQTGASGSQSTRVSLTEDGSGTHNTAWDGKTFSWEIEAFDSNGGSLGKSDPRTFTFKPSEKWSIDNIVIKNEDSRLKVSFNLNYFGHETFNTKPAVQLMTSDNPPQSMAALVYKDAVGEDSLAVNAGNNLSKTLTAYIPYDLKGGENKGEGWTASQPIDWNKNTDHHNLFIYVTPGEVTYADGSTFFNTDENVRTGVKIDTADITKMIPVPTPVAPDNDEFHDSSEITFTWEELPIPTDKGINKAPNSLHHGSNYYGVYEVLVEDSKGGSEIACRALVRNPDEHEENGCKLDDLDLKSGEYTWSVRFSPNPDKIYFNEGDQGDFNEGFRLWGEFSKPTAFTIKKAGSGSSSGGGRGSSRSGGWAPGYGPTADDVNATPTPAGDLESGQQLLNELRAQLLELLQKLVALLMQQAEEAEA